MHILINIAMFAWAPHTNSGFCIVKSAMGLINCANLPIKKLYAVWVYAHTAACASYLSHRVWTMLYSGKALHVLLTLKYFLVRVFILIRMVKQFFVGKDLYFLQVNFLKD